MEAVDMMGYTPFGAISINNSSPTCMETSLCTWKDKVPVPYCSIAEHLVKVNPDDYNVCEQLKKSKVNVQGCYTDSECGGKVNVNTNVSAALSTAIRQAEMIITTQGPRLPPPPRRPAQPSHTLLWVVIALLFCLVIIATIIKMKFISRL